MDHQSTSDFSGQGPDGVSKIEHCCVSSAVFGRDQFLTVDLLCVMLQYSVKYMVSCINSIQFSGFQALPSVTMTMDMSLQRKSPNVKVV